MSKVKSLLLALLVAAPLACKPPFNPKLFTDPAKLWAAAMAEYKAGRFDNAAKAFEKLTLDLPARDPRLPLSYYYLAQSQTKNGEYLLAAGTYNRLIDAFPQDTLVDDAFYLSGRAYEHEWRAPELDATYGKSAQSAYEAVVSAYPDSPFASQSQKELTKLDEWFAEKDYGTGYLYLKRKAFDSAIIYFKDVIRLHPKAKKTKDAYLRLLESYRAIKYTEDARDLCDSMRTAYPNDRDVKDECGPAPAAPVTPAP
jgi:outer membrane protein assembly factor BamD